MDTLRILLESDSTITDGPAVMAGLLAMSGGADFADGVIAHLGAVAGADVFATFDKNASTALASTGVNTLLIG
jgi:predicted nucleic-acid-binding protein